jgi:hypothetical protein
MEGCAREPHCTVSSWAQELVDDAFRRLGWDRDGVEMMSLMIFHLLLVEEKYKRKYT